MAMGMRSGLTATVLIIALATSGCEQSAQEPASGGETEAVTTDNIPEEIFARAMAFECDGGETLEVVIESGETDGAIVRTGDGSVHSLPYAEGGSGRSYAKDGVSLDLQGSQAVWTRGESVVCNAVSKSLPAPVAAGVVRDLTASDNGSTIEVKVGDTFSVSLSGVPTAGYVWAPENLPTGLEVTAGLSGATSSNQNIPGFTGGNHWEVTTFRAVAAGRYELQLAQRRPWEPASEPAASTFKAVINVVVD
jgi:predicted secreted protein